MQTNVSPKRAVSEEVVWSGFFLHIRVCKRMSTLIGLFQRERSGLDLYCLHYGLHKNIGVQFDFVCSIVFFGKGYNNEKLW